MNAELRSLQLRWRLGRELRSLTSRPPACAQRATRLDSLDLAATETVGRGNDRLRRSRRVRYFMGGLSTC